MADIDEKGVEYSDDKRTLLRCPEDFKGGYVTPEGVTWIGWYAFSGCTGLTSIEIPSSVTEIGGGAFEGCTALTSIEIPDSVKEIGEGAFSGCTRLTSIEIPDSVAEIGVNAFEDTEWYSNQHDGLVYAGKVAYCYKGEMPGRTSVILREETLAIADAAFSGRTALTSIDIPDSVTEIGLEAFSGCTALASIEIPDSVTEIGVNAFEDTGWYSNQHYGMVYAGKVAYCYKGEMLARTSVILREETLAIANSAFDGCAALTSIEIPGSVIRIGWNAFYHCTGLTSIEIPDSVTWIGGGAFSGCNLRELHIRQEHPELIDVVDDAFLRTSKNCILYVPIGTEDIYRQHLVFGKFKEVVPERI